MRVATFSGGKPSSADLIAETVVRAVGVQLPAAFCVEFGPYNGAEADASNVFGGPPLGMVGADSFVDLCTADEVVRESKSFADFLLPNLLSIGCAAGGNYICVDPRDCWRRPKIDQPIRVMPTEN